jgi:phosphatidylserine/phosphatidylglycerophosphate/cardiolipin synthase-like enzyme
VCGGVVVRYYCDSDPVWTHSKYLLVEGKYYGSANWSTNSLRRSDETVLQLEDSTVFTQYLGDFRAARDSARTNRRTARPSPADPWVCPHRSLG